MFYREAWKDLGSMSESEAMYKYINLLGNLDPEWEEKVLIIYVP